MRFRVAQRLGMTVATLDRTMSYRELQEWSAFDQIEIDDSWYQNALLRLEIRRALGDKKTKLDDLLPPRRRVPVKQSVPVIAERMRAYSIAQNAKVRRRPAPDFLKIVPPAKGMD